MKGKAILYNTYTPARTHKIVKQGIVRGRKYLSARGLMSLKDLNGLFLKNHLTLKLPAIVYSKQMWIKTSFSLSVNLGKLLHLTVYLLFFFKSEK